MWLLQISDPHVTVPGRLLWDSLDANARLLRLLAHLRRHGPRPDLVLVTGDLVGDEEPAAYAFLAGALADLGAPVLPLAGNHDDRALLDAAFPDVPGRVRRDGRLLLDLRVGPVRLLGLDTVLPGRVEGAVGEDQRRWLAARLAAATEPVLLALHHPPRALGLPYMDRIGLVDGEALEETVAAAGTRLRAVLAGHLHRFVLARFAGAPLLTAPSTAFTCAEEMLGRDGVRRFVAEPPAALLHRLGADGTLTTFPVVAGPHPEVPPRRRDGEATGGG